MPALTVPVPRVRQYNDGAYEEDPWVSGHYSLFSPRFFRGCIFPAAAEGWQHVGAVQRVEKLTDGVELTAGSAKVRVTVFRDGIFRVRVAPHGTLPKDSSWAVIEAPEPVRKNRRQQDDVRLSAGNVNVIIQKSPLLITFADAHGRVSCRRTDSADGLEWPAHAHLEENAGDENYYGLGDKAGPMNRRNRAFTNWNTDDFGWEESTDPLYKTIPFFIGLRKGAAYGLFFDNTYRSSFDFGKESPDYLSFGAEGGELNYYFFAGPEPKKVIEEYTALVGRHRCPPLWRLGYQQCRYTYYPESRAREIVDSSRKKNPSRRHLFRHRLPEGLRALHHQPRIFPALRANDCGLSRPGLPHHRITDLHIKKDPGHGYAPYDSGIKEDVFVKNPDGSVFVGPVWPGDSVFPDFTLSRVREWWGGLYKDFVGMGVAGFWNDMNEPSVFERADKTMPLDTGHRLDDGTSLDHRAIHNVFGMQNVRATYEGLRKLQAKGAALRAHARRVCWRAALCRHLDRRQ